MSDHPRIAAYGSYPPELSTTVTVLQSAPGAMYLYPQVNLGYSTAGYEPAGSMVRWTEPYWFARYRIADGGIHGGRFTEEAGARALFAKLTDPQKVSRMRQEDAQRADAEREMAAECAKRAASVAVEAAKTYRTHWQYRADFGGLRVWCGYERTKASALAAGRRAVEHEIRRTLAAWSSAPA